MIPNQTLNLTNFSIFGPAQSCLTCKNSMITVDSACIMNTFCKPFNQGWINTSQYLIFFVFIGWTAWAFYNAFINRNLDPELHNMIYEWMSRVSIISMLIYMLMLIYVYRS